MHVTGWFRAIAIVVLAVPAASPARAQQPAPHATAPAPQLASAVPQPAASLPALGPFLDEVRRHIRLDSAGQAAYTCVQRETEVKLDGDGKPTETTTRLYEIYPAAGGVGQYRRLVSTNGVRVPANELADADRKRRNEIEERAREFRTESVADRDRRLRREADERREREALVGEIFRLVDFRLVDREWLAGRPAIVLAFSARPNASASTRMGSMVQKLAGRVWVDEQDFEVVRVEGRAVDDVTYGFGMFARVYKGTTVVWERQKVNEETWVPVRLEIRANARVLMFRRLSLHRIIDYFDYRKSSVSTSASFGTSR